MKAKCVMVLLAVILIVLLAVAGCGVEEARQAGERASEDGSGSAGESRATEDNSQASGTTRETTLAETTEDVAEVTESTSQSTRVLADKWYVDSDGNKVPDFIEVEKGYNPKVNDCAQEVDCPGPSGASSGAGLMTREQNTLLILGSSGSMAAGDGTGGWQTKMQAAKNALERYVTGTTDFVNLGFMVYGHKGSNTESDREESCAGIDVPDALGEVDYESFPQTLESFQPTGWTPIAGSLDRAAEEFKGKEDAGNRVILVTDGLETCGGAPVASARRLDGVGISVTVDVVGFDIGTSGEQAALREIAEVTGGEYFDAQTGADLEDYFSEQRRMWSELTDQYLCSQVYSNSVLGCMMNFNNETVASNMGNKIISAIGQSTEKKRDVIKEIQTNARNHLEEERKAVKAANEEPIAKIREDLREAQQRMRERYNEDISFSPLCPDSTIYASLRPQVTIAQGYLQ